MRSQDLAQQNHKRHWLVTSAPVNKLLSDLLRSWAAAARKKPVLFFVFLERICQLLTLKDFL
jgi:hypothetical protein